MCFKVMTCVKRASPGFITDNQLDELEHDYSTLPGSSGSVLIDSLTAAAVGLHNSGNTKSNVAVPVHKIVHVLSANKIASRQCRKKFRE
jgi:hypothetical protein